MSGYFFGLLNHLPKFKMIPKPYVGTAAFQGFISLMGKAPF